MGPFRDHKRWRSAKPKVERDRSHGNPADFALLRALVILMFGALILQLINLQVIRGDEFKQRAEINALREVPLPAARGLILDRNGQPLVQNSAQFSAAIVPGDLPERGETAVYRLVSGVVGIPVAEVEAKVRDGVKNQGEYSPAVIKQDIDRDAALQLLELVPHAPGLQVIVEPSRRYLAGSLLSHVLGYVGPISAEEYAVLSDKDYLLQDFLGKTGVESTYEGVLRGKPGGSNLVLSIDLDLQRKTAEVLNEFAVGSENAAAAVMDVKTGELLSMYSYPTFDSNAFSGPLTDQDLAALVDSPGKPLVNHLIAERYPPGSTFKTIVGAGALQEGVAAPWTTITSRGYITVENEFDPNVVYVYPDWAPLGALDFYGGVAMSSNVYFYYLAGGNADEGFRGLGEAKVADYARAFGFGEPTGIDLPGESPGLVPDAPWKEQEIGEPWTLGDTYNFGIGQGYVAATPLQVLSAMSAVANGGELLTPRVVKEYQDNHGNVLQSTDRVLRNNVPVSAENLGTLRAAMRQSVTAGVAKKAAIGGVEVAGKTGTAEFGPRLSNGKSATHGWFVGFAPYNDPQIAIVVFVQRGSGGDDASPAAAKILDYYFNAPRLAQQVDRP